MANFKRRIQSANAKILNLERRYGKDSQIVQRAYHTLNKAQGTKDLTRYRMPKNANTRTYAKLDRGLSLIENSKYTSKKGREEIRQKGIDSFLESHGGSYVEAEKLFDYFENSINWDRLRELGGEYGSDFYVDAVQRQQAAGLDNSAIDKLTLSWLRKNGLKYERKEEYWEYVNRILGDEQDNNKLTRKVDHEFSRIEKKTKNSKYIR